MLEAAAFQLAFFGLFLYIKTEGIHFGSKASGYLKGLFHSLFPTVSGTESGGMFDILLFLASDLQQISVEVITVDDFYRAEWPCSFCQKRKGYSRHTNY